MLHLVSFVLLGGSATRDKQNTKKHRSQTSASRNNKLQRLAMVVNHNNEKKIDA